MRPDNQIQGRGDGERERGGSSECLERGKEEEKKE